MDYFEELMCGPNAELVILTFLHHADCGNAELQKELRCLGKELHFTRDINSNGLLRDTGEDHGEDHGEDGELETDGHFSSSIREDLGDIRPHVGLDWPVNPEEAAALREVAAGLMEIADQLEHSVVARATQNLARRLSNAPMTRWKDLLTLEVEWVLQQGLGLGLEHLPQERVIVALALTLVKGVCQRAPQLLRHLFNAALQYIIPAAAR